MGIIKIIYLINAIMAWRLGFHMVILHCTTLLRSYYRNMNAVTVEVPGPT